MVYIAIPIAPLVARDYSVSTPQPWIGSLPSIVYAAFFLVFGPLSDRLGRRRLLVGGVGALAATTALTGLASSLVPLVLFRVLEAVAGATYPPVAWSFLGLVLPPEFRNAGFAIVTTGYFSAGIVGQIFGSAVGHSLGWHWVFWILALVYVLLTLMLARWLPADPPPSGRRMSSAFRRMPGLIVRPELAALYAAALTLLLSFVAMYSALAADMAAHPASVLRIRLVGLAGILLSPLLTPLTRRLPIPNAAAWALSAAACGLILEALAASSGWLPGVAIASGLYACAIALSAPPLIAGVLQRVDADVRGAAASIFTFALFAGAGLGPLLALGLQHSGLASVCWMSALVVLGGAGAVYATSPRRSRSPQSD